MYLETPFIIKHEQLIFKMAFLQEQLTVLGSGQLCCMTFSSTAAPQPNLQTSIATGKGQGK